MKSPQQEPIAIVGSACRFPGGANSPSGLWDLLQSPRDVSVDIGPDRFDAKTFYHPDGSHHGTSNVLRSYLLQEDVRTFDAAFFNLSPNEADSMDPQQRILLEVVYEALEAGGHPMESLRGSNTAVYVGTMTADWNDLQIRDHNVLPKYYATGTNRAIISNRVSYFFDWHGPSMTIDTACSSSLVALHQGVQSLRSGESRVAVACGTQLLLGPEMYIGESKLKMLSPNGRSAMWDEGADGYARGEGVAAVLLKRLSDAIVDGDHIECIVRETGINQDGFSNGLTVPNSEAQAVLIRQTYARAGLDPENVPEDRPQFFEAHGTGTQAGDPREAAAIHECFGRHNVLSDTTLYVGSIKTVIGHLEGCAGLAGVLKGAAMLQAGQIPPNMHFRRLNPKIEPFYAGLQVPTRLNQWPQLSPGSVRRVSVNSFGFGGTNAHAILEDYHPPLPKPDALSLPSIAFTPFVFSASSEVTLVAQLQAYSRWLKLQDETLKCSDLAWTLHSRRSQLSIKATFTASTVQQLASVIDAKLAETSQDSSKTIGLRSNTDASAPRLLGVFTGQGAQWAAMGAQLSSRSTYVRQRIDYLEESLTSLPSADRPRWKLYDEMMKPDSTSRISEAALSQPLCTAIQIVLVDLLREAGVTFAAVVGHSSGDISAAYAAGFISARSAIRIAYYRGLYAHLAGNNSTGQRGAMMAVGISKEDAQALVDLPNFKDRIAVAAHNSPASITLSGDSDAILEAKTQLDREKKFARLLKVDTAYHSNHMLPCCDRYVQALQACDIQINNRQDTSCTWFSSVTGSPNGVEESAELQAEYWRDNMLNTVLFADAVKNAVTHTQMLDLAIEVGPHPALKGPATQNIAEVQSASVPYCGVLSRGKNDVEAFSEALGFMWVRFPHLVKFSSFADIVSEGRRTPKLVKGLPLQQWNHSRFHWSESRSSRAMRTRKHAHHEILGFLSTDSNSRDKRWSNIIKQKEISWLDGHRLQGQTVFPAAGYIAMALEACRVVADNKPVQLMEVHQLSIPKAMVFDDDDESGVETLVTLTAIEHHSDHTVTADFACYSTHVLSSGSENNLELSASATVNIMFGHPDLETLPSFMLDDYNMSTVDSERFYETISELGYNYSGSFRTLSAAKRRFNCASALVSSHHYEETAASDYLLHPSMLDVAFHAAMLAYSAPGDRRLWSLMVPVSFGTIRVNPELCATLPMSGCNVPVCATLDDDTEEFSASIDLFSEDGLHGMVQIEDFTMKPVAPATSTDDRIMFTNTKFGLATPNAAALIGEVSPSKSELELANVCERISFHLLQKWNSELSHSIGAGVQPCWSHLALWMKSTLSAAVLGHHSSFEQGWSEDTAEAIQALIVQHAESIDVKLLIALDSHLSAIARGDAAFEQAGLPDLLNEWYEKGLGFAAYNSMLSTVIMTQVTHRYPHARILQLGAGVHGITESIFENIKHARFSYTYTNRSEYSLAEDQLRFKKYGEKIKFGILDIECPPADQGFEPHSYDVVVASHMLPTTTTSISNALENIRTLLRPGGYIILAEVTDPGSTYHQSILSALPERWLSVNDDSKVAPMLTLTEWHHRLRKAGFGGVDSCTPENAGTAWPMSIIVSQAVDDRVKFLRHPLSSTSPARLDSFFLPSLVILGDGSLLTARIGEQVSDYLERFCGEITTLNGLPTEQELAQLHPMTTFLNLVDLDTPIFRDMTDDKMSGIKRMLEVAKHVVWVTCGGHQDEPYQMASIAFGRSIRQEAGHINLSHIDVFNMHPRLPRLLAEHIVRQSVLDDWSAPPSALSDSYHQECEFLWSREPEIVIDGGEIMVPRLVPNWAQNSRLNSTRRAVSRMVPTTETTLEITSLSESFTVAVMEQTRSSRQEPLITPVKIQSSSLNALCVTTGNFLYLGISVDDAGMVQAHLSTKNSGQFIPITSVDVAVPENTKVDADAMLIAVESGLLAEALVQQLPRSSRVLIHCSGKDRFLATALSRNAPSYGIESVFTCGGNGEKVDPSWICLSNRTSRVKLRNTLRLLKPTHYLDLTARTSHDSLSGQIFQALSPSCTMISSTTLFQHDALLQLPHRGSELLESSLSKAVLNAALSTSDIQDQVTQLDDVHTMSPGHATSIVHWPSDRLVEALVRPLAVQSLFSRDKTYLLVGLSGQIGQSLSEWMVANGAGCVCLTSRRPNVDAKWLQKFEGRDAKIKILAMDVLSRSSIENVVKEIRASCPPIGGIANGAVIFDDSLFESMSGDMMRRVLAAKIDGSKNLDEVFYHDDLEFFILFSSIVCVYGNPGQSNYAAANGYVNALARQRRRRGLAASSLVLGLVAGIGHAESAGAAVQDQLVKKIGLPPVSETDLRQTFAETILTGFQRSDDLNVIPEVEVICGIREYADDEQLRGPWFSNPIFSHLVKNTRGSGTAGDRLDESSMLPVRQKLNTTTSEAESFQVIQECFATRLSSMLQLIDQKIEYEAPLLELGIDSLVAVEVRSWFLKELGVDIPVLKVVGGASLSDLCKIALEKFLAASVITNDGQKDGDQPSKAMVDQSVPSAGSAVERKLSTTTESSLSSSSDGVSEIFDREREMESPASTVTMRSPTGSVADLQKLGSVETTQVKRPLQNFVKSVPISLPQSRFWFLRQLLTDPTTPNVIISWHVKGNVRVGDLERAVRLVANRHEALRTCFEDGDNAEGAYQHVLSSSLIRLERKRIHSAEEADAEYSKLRNHVFDLEKGDVMRVVLLTQSSSDHYLMVNYHHIVMDGGSFNVFFSDLERAYMGQSLGASPRQYPEFSTAQREAIEIGDMTEELNYWQLVFKPGEQPPVLPLLPMARTSTRLPMIEFDTHQVFCQMDSTLAANIKSVARAQRCTPFHLHLAAFKTMLFCLAKDTDDLTIGIADAARNDSTVEKSIGFFLNLLTLRFRRQPSQTFADSIVEARRTAHAALESSRLPFDVLLSEMNVARSSSHSPFFQAFLDYRQGLEERHPWGNCEVEFQGVHPGRTAYDITLDVTDWKSGDSRVVIRVQKSLYDLTAASLLLDTYIHFLEAVTGNVSLPLSDTPLFGEKQLAQAVQIGRGPNLVSEWPETLPHRIEQISIEHGDRVALMDGSGKILTYSNMRDRIQAISESLQKSGVSAGSRVLVYQLPAVDWTCSMLAIMRIGAVYVPLDLRNPISRLSAVAKDCEASVILADSTTLDEAPQLLHGSSQIINVSALPMKPLNNFEICTQSTSPAAILYTSGSTGTPKGITVSHAGLRNEIEGYTKQWGLGAERVLQQSAFTFNHSSDQMYTGLVNGGMVYIVPDEKRGDPTSITKIIQQHSITYTKATPSEYSMWIRYGGEALRQATNWRFAFGGGESLTTITTDEFSSLNLPQLHFFNSYGPTEISISSHKMAIPYNDHESLRAMGRVPCGYSLPNYHTYIVDEQLKPVPVGMPGEICIGGAGVSRGYLNNPELTSKHFVLNRFATSEDIAHGWTHMYRTNDIGHLQRDGAMVFHSRMAGDSQVKIRGLRIELSDIESNIISSSEGMLREAVVTLRESDPPFLVAHVVCTDKLVWNKGIFLRDLLSRLPLPQYMIPVMAIPMEKLPLNNHSKVDRKAVLKLPLPEATVAKDVEDTIELSETMLQLKHAWRVVLGSNFDKLAVELSPSSDFFRLGGNSLLIVRLSERLRRTFRVAIPLFELLRDTSLGGMARKVEENLGVELIDWEQETSPPSLPRILHDLPVKPKTATKTILITGATGFLGKFILPKLAGRLDVGMIHCIAVRDKSREASIFSSPKVSYHVGDLTLPFLGLSEADCRHLSNEVDVIIHLGALRSFWDNYHVLRAGNVDSIKELVKLGAPNRAPIHFISTIGVLPPDEIVTEDNATSASAYTPTADGNEGYVASKWASERILERSVQKYSIPATIYRFLPSTSEQPSERQQLLDAFTSYVDILSTRPEMGLWNGRIDLVPAEQAANWLTGSVFSNDASTASEAKFFHHRSPLSIHTDELDAHIERERGDRTDLKTMPFLKWLGRCKAVGFDYLVASQQATVGDDQNGQILSSRR